MNIYKYSIALLITLLLTSCVTLYVASFSTKLTNVKLSKFDSKSGNLVSSEVNDIKLESMVPYQDSLIQISWSIINDAAVFSLKNTSNMKLKLNWDEAIFIDTKGVNHHISHSGVDYYDRNEPQVSASIYPQGVLSETITPTDHLYLLKLQNIEPISTKTPFLPVAEHNKAVLIKCCEEYKNKLFQIVMPIESDNFKYEYLFTFTVCDYNIEHNIY